METSPEQHNFKKNFECIYYPAKVQNVERAVQTLGGTNQMSEILNAINERLDLRFRPDDPYCKAASGDRTPCSGLVLNVRIIRKKKKSGKQTVDIEPHVLGTVSSWFQFRSLSDYQYLPVKLRKDGSVDDFLPSIVFSNFTRPEDLNKNVELFLPPVFFSRMDTPQMHLRLLHDSKVEEDESIPENMIGVNRKPRQSFANIVSFDREEVPQPIDNSQTIARYIQSQLLTQEDVDAVMQLFAERPVLSKMVLRSRLGVPHRKIKLILPLVAYYFYTGPYRIMWVRLGYDPRVDKSSARLQVLDFRLRNALGSSDKYMTPPRRIALIRLALRSQKAASDDPEDQLPDKYAIFRPGYIPPYKQMYYQLCDIHIPEVQQYLDSVILRDECHERFGWYPDNVLDKVRNDLSDIVLKTLDDLGGAESIMDDSCVQLDDDAVDDEEEEDLDADFD